MATNVTNTDADLEGNTLVVAENDQTITGLHTFSRLPAAPFAVAPGSPVVPGLDADTVDGLHAAALLAGQIQVATVTLDNNTIKALPTTPVTIVPAPAAGVMLVPLLSMLMFKGGSVAYANVDPDAYMVVESIGTAFNVSSYLANDTGLGLADLTSLLVASGDRFERFAYPFTDNRGDPSGWGPMSYPDDISTNVGQGLQISLHNQGAGDLTGGDSANQIKIVTFYLTVTVP